MRGADKDKIILSILKEGAKKPVELRDEAVKRGVSRSTFYTHIEKLVKNGEVKEARYQLIPQIEEADRGEVDYCLKTLLEERNPQIIYSRLKQLTHLSYDGRVAHFPNVIQKIADFLDKEEITGNERNLNQFFECLNALLFFEQEYQGINWKEVRERLVNHTIEKASNLLLKSPNDRIIEYLGRTNREDAVTVLFRIMKQGQIEAGKNEFSSIAMALGRDRLYKEHSRLINQNLDDLLRSNEERLINLGLALRERIR